MLNRIGVVRVEWLAAAKILTDHEAKNLHRLIIRFVRERLRLMTPVVQPHHPASIVALPSNSYAV